ncbi:MAG: PQQ-binding-like beta-propeller repeat protein [Rhodobacteraceae bacterium]|nr:PQQ-binding-like beta-propeller repeat protein [Paracoccaceae bacterium]
MLGLAVLVVLATGCAKKELILEGQRFDVRTPLADAIPDANAAESDQTAALNEQINRAIKINLPRPGNLTAWTHRNGGADHFSGNLALGADLTRMWSANIGAGNSRKHRITSDPIVAGGRIYTLDAQSRVMAHSTIGAAIWVRELIPASDRAEEATGGGLAYEDGVIFATTGFGEVSALNAADGNVIWTQKLDAPVVAPPTVSKGTVFVVSRDNRAWALKASNGRIDWQQQSTRADAGLIGGAAPAVSGRMVILPFSSGELVAAMANNGLRSWSVAVSGSRRGQARSNIGDISSDPVITRNRVYAANQSGRVTAVSLSDGERIWTANEGSYSPVWPVDNSVFLVSDAAQLVRLDARNGEVIWAVDLPAYRKDKTRRDSFAHFGPVLAGGRLLVASSDGVMRGFDPVSGDLVSSIDIPSGAASQPVIVDGVLYVLSQNGQLHAYR